jgi:hypothetical protein
MRGAFPNLLVIGAQKAGTTLLHGLLAAQQGVAMSATKELDFFTSERGNWRRGIDWYRAQFDPAATVRGESSPSYTAHPFAEGVPERIASVLDDVRLAYVVRDPIDRLISSLRHAIGTGEERRTVSQVLDGPELEGTAYIAMSRYAMQLDRYRAVFGPDAVLIVDFAELIANPGAVVGRVLAHTGNEIAVRIPDRIEPNPAADWPVRRAVRRAVPERLARRLLEAPPIRRLDHRLTRPAPRLQITPAQRARLESLLSDDTERLRDLTGMPLAGWSL